MTDVTAGVASDLFIIGGGINGCGIARDAVGRGLSVRLAEQSSYPQGSAYVSSNLIHVWLCHGGCCGCRLDANQSPPEEALGSHTQP